MVDETTALINSIDLAQEIISYANEAYCTVSEAFDRYYDIFNHLDYPKNYFNTIRSITNRTVYRRGGAYVLSRPMYMDRIRYYIASRDKTASTSD